MGPRTPNAESIAIAVTADVFVLENALTMTAVRASGPGGQNVNKVASKVDIRLNVAGIVGLDEDARQRLMHKAAARIDAEGNVRVTSQKTRDQAKNILDAYEKIRVLIAAALVVPKPRKPTRPTKRAVEKRLDQKKQTGERKKHRARRHHDESL
ncbi:MAG TPA: alternative ribosome rescue aminoacyl-tRNA hydrolase ArfB [Polyangium sp.]|jgi:ribosome-associated protein|nr:alternative ribosome rescue aminoacyl-tRNA hydrolase ArfB [Polyangium sp.]